VTGDQIAPDVLERSTNHQEEASMHAHIVTATAFSIGVALAFGTPAMSADLPQSGIIKIHSTAKDNSQVVDVGDKHVMGSGNLWGVTYNDAGSGPLHMGAWFCTYTFQTVNSPAPQEGACAFGDAGGADKILIVWSGTNTESEGDHGTGTIIGGIGKYAGIQGKMTYQCKPVDPAHELSACTQQFDYQLTSVSANK
jgi:hypothetical protein